MAPNSRIGELAAVIHEQIQQVDTHLISENIPSPSFDVSCPRFLPKELQASRQAILAACDELTALMLGPTVSVLPDASNWVSFQAIQRFGLAKSFPPSNTATFSEIASRCSLNKSDTRRLLRHAMTHYIFKEVSPGVVAHTALSKAIAEMPSLEDTIGFVTVELWPSATRVVDAMEKWPNSEEPNEAGFSLANGTDIPMFDYVSRNPERAAQMARTMTYAHTNRPGYAVSFLYENFEWGSAAQGLLVDVGGANGSVAIDIARHLPDIRCIVQDTPMIIGNAKVPEDLSQRLQFMAHDFFTPQPVQGADVYLFRWTLHDWSDSYAIRILRNLIPSLKKGARILVSDLCLPPPCVLSPYEARPARHFDMDMKMLQNAKERDADDWAQLFELADPKFKFHEIKTPKGSILSLVCATWEG